MNKNKKNSGEQKKRGAQMRSRAMTAVPAAVGAKASNDVKPDIVVSSRELMFNATGIGAFSWLGASARFPGYDINPANSLMFPWLSQVSRAYEKYRFESLEFEIIPRNPTTSNGAIYAAVDYDWDDDIPRNVNELMSNKGAISSDVWTQCKVVVDCARMNEGLPWRYVATQPRTDTSQRMTYSGFFMAAVAGATGNVNFDFFANYRVRLSLPCLHSSDTKYEVNFPAPVTAVAGQSAYFDALPVVPGVEAVKGGSAGIPLFLGSIAANAYRMSAGGKGTISMAVKAATAGSPPSTFVNDTDFRIGVYDDVGTGLTTLGNTAYELISSPWQGVNVLGEWGTNDKPGKSVIAVDIAALRRNWASAAYLVPYLVSAAGRVFSTASSVSTRYTEL